MTVEEITCAFSGHRPEKLPWGTHEQDPRCLALKLQMEKELRRLCEAGVRRFIFGMARGADQYFLEILCRIRKEYPLTVEAAIPCPMQQKLWPREEQREYLVNLGKCDRTHVLEDHYSEGCMLRRNRFMVEHAQILMTVWDGSGGGTASTVAYAKARGLTILPMWL